MFYAFSFLHSFALILLENLHHFSNLCSNFQFNLIWHGQSMATLIICRRLPESDITVMPSVMCMDWLYWWYNHAVAVVSSSTVFHTNINEKRKSTSPSTIQVKNQQKTISNEEKIDIINQFEQCKQPANICHIVRLPGSSVCTIHDSSDRIKKVSN
jgi:hypothetical protein